MPGSSPAAEIRASAARIVSQTLDQGRSLDELLAADPHQGSARGLKRSLCYGTLRWHFRLVAGEPKLDEADGAYDRFVSTFVLDLLSETDIVSVLAEAHRILEPRGLLAITSLSKGSGLVSRTAARAWSAVHRLRPSLVGGCRPLDLEAFLAAGAMADPQARAPGALRGSLGSGRRRAAMRRRRDASRHLVSRSR